MHALLEQQARMASVVRIDSLLYWSHCFRDHPDNKHEYSVKLCRAAGDALRVLGLAPCTPGSDQFGEARKKYLQLSVLVHPDKTSNPRAQQVIQISIHMYT